VRWYEDVSPKVPGGTPLAGGLPYPGGKTSLAPLRIPRDTLFRRRALEPPGGKTPWRRFPPESVYLTAFMCPPCPKKTGRGKSNPTLRASEKRWRCIPKRAHFSSPPKKRFHLPEGAMKGPRTHPGFKIPGNPRDTQPRWRPLGIG